MKNRLPTIKNALRTSFPMLRENFSVQKIGIFGSVARGDQTNESDIDILVDFNKPVGLFHFVKLEDHLSSLLGKPVDLVTIDALKPQMRNSILQETIYV